MAWIYLAESADSPSPFSRWSNQSPTVKVIDTLNLFYYHEWQKGNYRKPPSGTTFKRSTLESLVPPAESTSSTVDSHVKTSALQETELAWKVSAADFSLKSSDYVAIFDRVSFSWKTSQLSLFGGLTEFCWNSLRSGMIRDGRLYQPPQLEPLTSVKDGGYWPTPTASQTGTIGKQWCEETQSWINGRPSLNTMASKNLWPTPRANDAEKRGHFDITNPRNGLPAAVKRWPTPRASDGAKGGPNQRGSKGDLPLPAAVMKFPTPCPRDYRTGDRADSVRAQTRDHSPNLNYVVAPGGQLNPTWVEWLMGYPLEWTVLEAWATQWFRSKRGRRSKDCAV
jgi:hypothetical protein